MTQETQSKWDGKLIIDLVQAAVAYNTLRRDRSPPPPLLAPIRGPFDRAFAHNFDDRPPGAPERAALFATKLDEET